GRGEDSIATFVQAFAPFRRRGCARRRGGCIPYPRLSLPKPPSLEGGSARRRGGCLPQDATPVQTLVSDI
ncbi:MAG: hypothetical protein LBM98_04660, partial [Oscillospiraceae bacterium]|nr:hypothetical protein [Oscillospiraceae bacterium]